MALLGFPVAWIIDLIAAGGMQLTLESKRNVILPPKAYTSTPMAPPLPAVPIVAITSSLPIASLSVDGSEATAADSQDVTPSIIIPKCCQIALTSIQSPE